MRILFLLAAFLSSALLFVVEPIAAKIVLPTFGGAPQVWNSSLLFFQVVLLLGYWYAHLNAKGKNGVVQRVIHVAIAVVAILALPVSSHTAWFHQIQSWVANGGPPMPLVLLALAGLVGLPFFALSGNSSMLQRWYALSGRPDADEPWFLYSAGNVGSMLALLAYPTLIEPRLTLSEQGRWWTGAFCVLVALLALCAYSSMKTSRKIGVAQTAAPSEAQTVEVQTGEAIPAKRKLLWLALSAVPSSLLLGVTTYLTSNIAPIPLLWVIPLALYLLTFILVFARKPIVPAAALGRIYPLVLTPLVLVIVLQSTLPILGLLHLGVFFIACWMCHSRLALLKPKAEHLTEFFFYVSLGGVLGGAFNTIIAPSVFETLFEYPVALVAVALLKPKPDDKTTNWGLDAAYPAGIAGMMILFVFVAHQFHLEATQMRTLLVIGFPLILCFLAVDSPTRFGLSIAAAFLVADGLHVSADGQVPFTARSFFGVHRIVLMDGGRFHKLINGNTIHGVQDMQHPGVPLTYYYPNGPIGQFMTSVQPKTAAFVGLGVGSLAAYGQPGDQYTYYEIDPVVKEIATNPKWFTFLRDSKAHVGIVLGDARLELAKSTSRYDLIVLDAFSSDAIPVHLLTEEAIRMYLSHLNPNGTLAFHISNRYLNLEPILAAEARELKLTMYAMLDGTSEEEKKLQKTESHWVIMAPSDASFRKLIHLNWWNEPDPIVKRAWTDDYSNVLSAFDPTQ